jgi:hypothetical protein
MRTAHTYAHLQAYGKRDSSVSLLVVQEQVFIGQGHVLDLLFSLHKTAKNGRFSRFSPFPLIVYKDADKERRKSTFLDVSRPYQTKGQAQKPLALYDRRKRPKDKGRKSIQYETIMPEKGIILL